MSLAVPRSIEAGLGCPGLHTKASCRKTIYPPHNDCTSWLPPCTSKTSHLFSSILIMNNTCWSCFECCCFLELPLCNVHVCTHSGLLNFLVVCQFTSAGAAVYWRSVSFWCTTHWGTAQPPAPDAQPTSRSLSRFSKSLCLLMPTMTNDLSFSWKQNKTINPTLICWTTGAKLWPEKAEPSDNVQNKVETDTHCTKSKQNLKPSPMLSLLELIFRPGPFSASQQGSGSCRWVQRQIPVFKSSWVQWNSAMVDTYVGCNSQVSFWNVCIWPIFAKLSIYSAVKWYTGCVDIQDIVLAVHPQSRCWIPLELQAIKSESENLSAR